MVYNDFQDPDEGFSQSDSRIQYIHDYVRMTLKIKPDKWKKMLNTAESRKLIQQFFERPEKKLLTIYSAVSLISTVLLYLIHRLYSLNMIRIVPVYW